MNDYNHTGYTDVREALWGQEQQPKKTSAGQNEKTAKILKIIALVLLALILLSLIKDALVNPLWELDFKTVVMQSYRIKIVGYVTYSSYRSESVIRIDGDKMSLKTDLEETEYYRYENYELYKYIKTPSGEWIISQTAAENDLLSSTIAILDYDNYERVPGKLFSWRIKDGVNTGEFYNVYAKRKMGKITVTAMSGLAHITITFDRFGVTSVKLPQN